MRWQTNAMGNCQFEALAHQLYKNSAQHPQVRRQVVAELRAHPELYAAGASGEFGFQHVDSYEAYCDKMADDGAWGDGVTMQAAATAFVVHVRICRDTEAWMDIHPARGPPGATLTVVHYAEVHYDSTQPLVGNRFVGNARVVRKARAPSARGDQSATPRAKRRVHTAADSGPPRGQGGLNRLCFYSYTRVINVHITQMHN